MSQNRLKSPNLSKHLHQEKLKSNINSKKIRYHLDKVISEFNILPKKLTPFTTVKHATKTLFWSTVYLTFTYLTITSSFEVIQQYRDNQTTTNMKAVINNKVTYLPNMTICYKIKVKKLLEIHSTSSFNYTSAWSRFFEETISPEGIFKVHENQTYDDEIYLSLLKYLAMIYEAERAWEPGLAQISTFHSKKSDEWIAVKKVLMPHIARYNITLEQLKSIFDGKICPVSAANCAWGGVCTSLLFLQHEPTNWAECIAESKISFIGKKTICFRLIGYQNSLTDLGATDYIYLRLHSDNEDQKWCQEFTVDLGTESRSTPRRATTRNESYAHYYNRFSGIVEVNMDIGVKALYRKLPNVKGDVQCSSDTTREECENKCFRGWIRANCHCSPITFNLTTDTSSYRNCTVDDYSICLKKYTENATYLCTNKCVPLCEQWHYEFGLESRKPEFYSSYFKIGLRTFDYIIIEQVFTWNSFEEFIGALGGALGIWLGLDFVIIIEFIVKVVTILIKKILLRNTPKSEEEKHEDSANIKNGEENVEDGISSSNKIGNRIVGHQKEYKENEREIAATSIRQINESERTLRKKRQSNSLKEKHVQQRRKRPNRNKVDRAMFDDKMKNVDGHDGRLTNHKVNKTDNIDAVQDEYTAHANYSNARCWFVQKIIVLYLNGNDSTKKPALFFRLVEKLFWTAIYLVGSVFTILWCVDLIDLYLADEAVYFPSLMINRTVSLPPPSFCISYDQYSIFERDDSISKALMDDNNIFNTLMDYFDQSNIDRASFLQTDDGKPWPQPLVSIGLLYFCILAISETAPDYDSDVNFTERYEWQLLDSTGENTQLRNDIDKSVRDILVPKLLEWNITANELRQKLGGELARMIELKISFTNSSGTTDFVNETSFYTVAVNNGDFCYSLPFAVNFTNLDDALEFSINVTSYPQLLKRSSWNDIIFSDYLLELSSYSFDLSRHNLAVYNSTFFPFYYGQVTKALISVDGIYTSRPMVSGVKYCSSNTTQSNCRAQCRIKLIEKLCNCSPTYWTAMIKPTSGLDECTFDRYMECLNYNASDDLACKASCLPSCTAKYFRSDLTWHDLSQKYEDTAIARLSVKDGMYMSIVEMPTFTFSNLLITV